MVKQLFLHIVCLALIVVSHAQGFKTDIKLSVDSITVGTPFEATVSIQYPVGKQLIFPDSLTSFGSFTFLNKTFEQTKSNDSVSVDQATFTLTSFELKSPQYLKTPIFLITKNDTITLYSDSILVVIKETVEGIPDNIQLKKNTEQVLLKKEINYPLITVVGLVLLVLVLILFFVFGGKVMRSIQINRIEKLHRNFKKQFEKDLQTVETNPTLAESVISKWKNHLTKISKTPYNSYSTSEIYALTKNEALKRDLRLFDELIYSKNKHTSIDQAKSSLLAFAEETVENRVKQIKQHGRKG